MKRIVQIAVVAIGFSAGTAWSQSQEQQIPQAVDNAEAYVNVAQASTNAERTSPAEQAQPKRSMSFYEWTGLAGDGSFPSRGGPLDD